MPVVYVIIGAASQNRVIKRKLQYVVKRHWLPDYSENLHRGFSNMLNPNLPSDLLSEHSSNTSFKGSSQQPGTYHSRYKQ